MSPLHTLCAQVCVQVSTSIPAGQFVIPFTAILPLYRHHDQPDIRVSAYQERENSCERREGVLQTDRGGELLSVYQVYQDVKQVQLRRGPCILLVPNSELVLRFEPGPLPLACLVAARHILVR